MKIDINYARARFVRSCIKSLNGFYNQNSIQSFRVAALSLRLSSTCSDACNCIAILKNARAKNSDNV